SLIAKTVMEQHALGHCCLVISKFREHVDILASIFESRGISLITLVGGDAAMNIDKVQKVLDGKVRLVLATIDYIGTGANIPPLDRLFLTTSIKSRNLLTQATGRIRRKCAGKTDAVVFEFIDDRVGILRNHYTKHRVPLYRNSLGVPRFKNTYYI